MRPRRYRRLRLAGDERGSASLVAVALITLLVTVTVAGVQVGSAVVARHRAQAAADLAALSGAAAIAGGARAACAHAGSIARTMRATVVDCSVDGLDLVVSVEVPLELKPWTVGPARASARAGPMQHMGARAGVDQAISWSRP